MTRTMPTTAVKRIFSLLGDFAGAMSLVAMLYVGLLLPGMV